MRIVREDPEDIVRAAAAPGGGEHSKLDPIRRHLKVSTSRAAALPSASDSATSLSNQERSSGR